MFSTLGASLQSRLRFQLTVQRRPARKKVSLTWMRKTEVRRFVLVVLHNSVESLTRRINALNLMLARRAARPGCTLRRTCQQPQFGLCLNQSRRTFVSLDVLKDGFLDLATALPIPPSWPAYSTTLILCTVLTRLAFTVPFSVWVNSDSSHSFQILH